LARTASDILAFTVSYGDRHFLANTVRKARASAGCWFDWSVYLGAASKEATKEAIALLKDQDRLGVQHLTMWPENRGQHHAFGEALKLARAGSYQWLVRIDDDIIFKTPKWLVRLKEKAEELRKLASDDRRRLVVGPRILGLRNPISTVTTINVGQNFPAEEPELLGGGCRLHPVEFLENFEPDIYAPLGRQDPQVMADYVKEEAGLLVRFPEVRVSHPTAQIEAKDSPEQEHQRRMGYYWAYLGEGV
jgi:glycosyltransferase involved in cell wall biosynthesis